MRALLARIRAACAGAGAGARLSLFGALVAVAAALGAGLWSGPPAAAAKVPGETRAAARTGPPRPEVAVQRAERQAAEAAGSTSGRGADPGYAAGVLRTGSRFLSLQEEWERRLTAKAVAALERAFPGRADATVNLELVPHAEVRSGVNLPPGGLPPTTIEFDRSADPAVSLLSDPNRTPAVTAFPSRMRRDPEHGVRRKDTDPDLYGRRTELPLAPAIRRITTTVVVDGAALAADEDPALTHAAVVEIVKHAIGFDAARGDRIHCSFRRAQAPLTAAAGGTGWWVWGLLLMLPVLGSLWFARTRTSRSPAPSQGEPATEGQCREIETTIACDPSGTARILGDWAAEVLPGDDGRAAAPARQVAEVLLAIDGRRAARVLSALSPERLQLVTGAMAEVRAEPARAGSRSEALAEACRRLGQRPRSTQTAPAAAGSGAPERSRAAGPSPQTPPDAPQEDGLRAALAAFEQFRADDLVDLLRDEHPQIAAVFIAHLEPRKAAAVIRAMPVERASDLVIRIATMDRTPRAAVERILSALMDKVASLALIPSRSDPKAWVGTAAEILKRIGNERDPILAAVQASDAGVARSIQEQMFRFDDLRLFDRKSMQRLLARIDSRTLATALKDASPEVEARVFDNLSKRAGEMVLEQRDLLGPVRISTVRGAQRQILEVVRRLVAESAIQQPNLTTERMV